MDNITRQFICSAFRASERELRGIPDQVSRQHVAGKQDGGPSMARQQTESQSPALPQSMGGRFFAFGGDSMLRVPARLRALSRAAEGGTALSALKEVQLSAVIANSDVIQSSRVCARRAGCSRNPVVR